MIERKNIIGFFGIDSYEIILFLSRILENLSRKVLLVDYSDIGDLTACIPVPDGLYVEDDIITYFGVGFTRKILDQDILNGYDDVLINFGFNYIQSAASKCTKVIYVINQQKYNISRLSTIPDLDIPKCLILKDMVRSKINQEYIMENIKKNVLDENIYTFFLDEIDAKCKLLAQYNTVYEFKKISNDVKNFLKVTIKNMLPELSDKTLKEIYKIAERGR